MAYSPCGRQAAQAPTRAECCVVGHTRARLGEHRHITRRPRHSLCVAVNPCESQADVDLSESRAGVDLPECRADVGRVIAYVSARARALAHAWNAKTYVQTCVWTRVQTCVQTYVHT